MIHTPDAICHTLDALVAPLLKDPAGQAFWAWAREDRLIVAFNPLNLRSTRAPLAGEFIHDLSTALGGVRIVPTNTRGVFLQIGYAAAPARLGERYPLDLAQQPDPLAVPVGMTPRGPLWVPIRKTLGVLIGGSPGFGKTLLLHSWIRALVQGQACQLVLYDGKGTHFARYAGQPGVTIAADLEPALVALAAELERRRALLAEHQVHDIDAYNALGWTSPLQPVVVIIDEAALIPPASAEKLGELARIGREWGLVLVCATQRTSSDEIHPAIKITLSTRICLPVPEPQDSRVVLGPSTNGADRLPKIPGRLKIRWGARITEAQGFFVDLERGPARLVPGPSPLPVGSDWQLAVRVMRESPPGREGVLSIPLLKGWGMSAYRAELLLKDWERAGWLTGDGQGALRRLAPAVLQAVSESLKVSESSESQKSAPQGPVCAQTSGGQP